MKQLRIILEYPDTVSLPEIKEYAQAALECWGGGKFPGSLEEEPDPLFYTTKAPKRLMRRVRVLYK